jgi:hypothetical protein
MPWGMAWLTRLSIRASVAKPFPVLQRHSLQDANIVRGELGLPDVPVAAPEPCYSLV